jgi:hypothetical protein
MATSSSGRDDGNICTVSGLEDNQSSLFHSEEDIKQSDTFANQGVFEVNGELSQASVIRQGQDILNTDDTISQAEEMTLDIEEGDLKRASLERERSIYHDLAGIQENRVESGELCQHYRSESFLAQIRQQFGADDVGVQQDSEFYSPGSDANRQQFPTISTTYCEDKYKYKLTSCWRRDHVFRALTSRGSRRQRMDTVRFAPQSVSSSSSTGE